MARRMGAGRIAVVTISTKTVPAAASQNAPRLWLCHRDGSKGAPSAASMIAIGWADPMTEGLLLLTNDAEVARLTELASAGWVSKYRVIGEGKLDASRLARMPEGPVIGGVRYGPVETVVEKRQGARVSIGIALREARGRGLVPLLSHLGLKPLRIIRLSFGPYGLGELPAGALEDVPQSQWQQQLGGKFTATHEDRRRKV